MPEETTPTVQVPAEVSQRALLHAREEVDPGCRLLATSDTGMVALALPDRLLGLPVTPDLELRLAAIARHFSLQGETTEAGQRLAATARHALGGTLQGRVARRVEPGRSPRLRRDGRAGVTALRAALR